MLIARSGIDLLGRNRKSRGIVNARKYYIGVVAFSRCRLPAYPNYGITKENEKEMTEDPLSEAKP